MTGENVSGTLIPAGKDLPHTLVRLIALARLLRQFAEDGDGSRLQHAIHQRDAHIRHLRHLAQQSTVVPKETEPLFRELEREDQKTLQQLKELRRRVGTELSSLRDSQGALAGYSRLARATDNLLEKAI